MKNQQYAVLVKNLTKKYADYQAVKGIDFKVKKGEVVAILGPNGAGKTSTVEMLEGFREPTSGTIKVLGVEPQKADRLWRSKIGMVLQYTSLDAALTVREILTMYRSFYPNPRRVDEVIGMVSLNGQENKRIGHLSGGQQRRVDVAIGIIGRPELLFLDEPTTGFDPVARRDSWNMIKQLCEEGMTVILTTHYMDEARFLADRVLVFVDGKIVADACPDALGGSLNKHSTIQFKLSRLKYLETLPHEIRRKLSMNGNSVSIITDHVHQALEQLIGWAKSHQLEFNPIISRPSLEDIYLQLVNQSRKASL